MREERPAGGRVVSAGYALIVALFAASCAAPPEAAPRQTLRVTVYQQANDGIAETLAQAFRTFLPDVDVEVQRKGTSDASVEAVQRGETDVTIAPADAVYLASVGQRDGQQAPFDRLRGIAVLQTRLIHLLVGKGSKIERIEELRGRRVAYSRGTETVAPLLLKAFGLRDGDVELVSMDVQDKLAQLIDGRLEAALFYGAYPLDEVKAATAAGARLLPLTGDPIDRLRHEYPFLRPFDIPDGVYLGGVGKTVGLNLVLICRSGLDERIVHAVTEAFFDALPALSALEASFRHVDLEQAPATPIALHAGAAGFYRERELAR